MLDVQKFEPVYIEFEGPVTPTEHGKRWLDDTMDLISRMSNTLRDLMKVAWIEAKEWDPRLDALHGMAGIPLAASGFSQYTAPKILDYTDGKTTTAFNPASVQLCLTPGTPVYTTTGVTVADGTSNYTGYARYAVTPASGWNAATTGAAPTVVTNNGQIQWAGCSGGGSITENGVTIADNATLNLGNVYFWGTITAVVISPTQTPPTIASGALSISLNTT